MNSTNMSKVGYKGYESSHLGMDSSSLLTNSSDIARAFNNEFCLNIDQAEASSFPKEDDND